MERLKASQKLIELSTDCLETMTSDDLRFSLKKPKFMHPAQLQTPRKTLGNIFLRESPLSVPLHLRKHDGRRLFRFGTDRALDEVTRTLEQVVPLRKLLANIQKKVQVLSTQIKEKNHEPEEPKKVMSLPGLGIYIVPKPPTSMETQQLGETHKRTASYSPYCPIVVHTRPSATNHKEGSESLRKSPSVSVVDRGTQPSPTGEPENVQHEVSGSDNFIHEEKCKLKSQTDESKNVLEKPAVATQTLLPAHGLTIDSETHTGRLQTPDGGTNNCCEKPAVATQTIPPSTVVGTSPTQAQERKLTKTDIDVPQVFEFPSPYSPPYLQYSQQVATNNYPNSGNIVKTDLFDKPIQTVSPVKWNPPSVNISCEGSQHSQDWPALNRNVSFTPNNKLAQAQEVYPTSNSYHPMGGFTYVPSNGDRRNVYQEQNVYPFPDQIFPSSLTERDRPLNIVQPQYGHTVNSNIGFPQINHMGPFTQTRELFPNCQQANEIKYPLYSGNDMGNYSNQRPAGTVFSEHAPDLTRYPPLNSFPTVKQAQDWFSPNQHVTFNDPNHIQFSQTPFVNLPHEGERDISFSKFTNDMEADSQQKQIVSMQNNLAENASTSSQMSRGGTVSQNNHTKFGSQESYVYSTRAGGLVPASRHGDFGEKGPFQLEVIPDSQVTTCPQEPEGGVSFSKSRIDTVSDSQQKQIVSVQNNPAGNISNSTQMSRGGIASQNNHMKFGSKENYSYSPQVGGLVCSPRFGDSLENDPFQLEVIPGVQVTTCPRTPEPSPAKEEVSPMSQMYLKLAEPWSRQRQQKYQKDDQAIGELTCLLSDPADTI